MRLHRALALIAALLLTLAAFAASGQGRRALGLTPGHTLLHANCPPGSHGKPRYAGVGLRLENARGTASAARALEDRAVTQRSLGASTRSQPADWRVQPRF